ncbi:MAG: hypothetical protein JW937_00460 [Candidatus Omnitrophica bacterium]|nr:hypothetical protein [Candidatus Omnitrophota bacterium]
MAPLLIAGLSLVPGAGHLAAGRRSKAAALFVIDIGIVCSLVFLKSTAAYILAGFVYLMAMVPAVVETYQLAQGKAAGFGESKLYICVLLLSTGFAALPLLWRSLHFSKQDKIVWSIAVSVLAILYFSFLGVYGMRLLNYDNNVLP